MLHNFVQKKVGAITATNQTVMHGHDGSDVLLIHLTSAYGVENEDKSTYLFESYNKPFMVSVLISEA